MSKRKIAMTSELTPGIAPYPLAERGNINLRACDLDALEIGESYRKARACVAESVRYVIEVGRALIRKKDSLDYGDWLPWLDANADALGFKRAAAARMMDAARRFRVNEECGESEALQISRQVWGNDNVRGTQGTGENEWYTPREYIEAARDVLGEIDLDPATSEYAQSAIGATRYFTKDDDGLEHEWHGRVWLNPPYAQPLIAHFVAKMIQEFGAGRTTAAIMLTHNYTDTEWFHNAAGVANAICFTRGRIRFYQPDGAIAAPTQGQTFFYFGDNVRLFTERFAEIGLVWWGARA
jgi:phage N-6-adenine-methyltransferase